MNLFKALSKFALTTFCVTLLSAPVVRAQTLKDAEAIVSQASSLQNFLNRPDLIDSYYEAMSFYYGEDRFPRKSYDAILTQLNAAISAIPELADRLWETENLGTAFEVSSKVMSSGRKLKSKAWDHYLEQWKTDLSAAAGKNITAGADELAKEQVTSLGNAIKKEMASAQSAPREGSKIEVKIQTNDLFKKLLQDERLQSLAAYYLNEYLNLEKISDVLDAGDADLILDTLKEIKNNPSLVLESRPESESIPALKSVIKNLIPSQTTLLSEESIFAVKKRRAKKGWVPEEPSFTRYLFRPLSRRFHGLWKGIPLKECVGGAPKGIRFLSPERWATIALKGAQLFNIEKDESYLGFLQQIPIRVKNKQIAYSVDLGSPLFRQKAFLSLPGTKPVGVKFFDLWLIEASKTLPQDIAGYAVGESSAINNAGALPTVRESNSYFLGKNMGEAKHIDPLAKKIIQFSAGFVGHVSYGGNMIFDATVKNAGELTLLADPLPLLTLLNSAEGAINAIKSLKTKAQKLQMMYFLGQQKVGFTEVHQWLVSYLYSKDWDFFYTAYKTLVEVRPSDDVVFKEITEALTQLTGKNLELTLKLIQELKIKNEIIKKKITEGLVKSRSQIAFQNFFNSYLALFRPSESIARFLEKGERLKVPQPALFVALDQSKYKPQGIDPFVYESLKSSLKAKYLHPNLERLLKKYYLRDPEVHAMVVRFVAAHPYGSSASASLFRFLNASTIDYSLYSKEMAKGVQSVQKILAKPEHEGVYILGNIRYTKKDVKERLQFFKQKLSQSKKSESTVPCERKLTAKK